MRNGVGQNFGNLFCETFGDVSIMSGWLSTYNTMQDDEQRRNSANYWNDKTSCEDLTLIYFVCKYLDRLNVEAKIPKSVSEHICAP